MSTTNTTCKLADSCQQIIDSKDKEIEKLESEIEDYEKREKYYRIFLIIQAGLLMIGFQVFDL